MRRCVLLMLTILVIPLIAQAQVGSSGDFRSNDRPATGPLVGPSGIPGVPPDPMRFSAPIGGSSSQDIVKSLDKDLGRSTLERTDERMGTDLDRKSGEDLGKGPPTTFSK